MRVNRRFLFWGVFLVAVGGVLVAADLRAVDTATLTDALRLWPLAVIAIGLSIVLRKSRWSVSALVAGSAIPGLVLGSAFALGPRFPGDCGARSVPPPVATAEGTFDGPASVRVRTGCGSLAVATAPGSAWRLDAANTTGRRAPSVESSASSLSIDTPHGGGSGFLDAGRDAWSLTLPTSAIDDLSIATNIGSARIDLPGARIGSLTIAANAADVDVDASTAAVAEMDAVVNVGSLSIRLPLGDLAGSFRVGAGRLAICAPPGLGLRVTSTGTAENVTVNDMEQDGSAWQNAAYETASDRADLTVRTTFGSVDIDPIGGCS